MIISERIALKIMLRDLKDRIIKDPNNAIRKIDSYLNSIHELEESENKRLKNNSRFI